MRSCNLIILLIIVYIGIIRARPQIVLEYRPSRPLYRPNPGYYPSQLVPPGPPWPSNIGGYIDFSQTIIPPYVNFENRFKETTTTKAEIVTAAPVTEQPSTEKPQNSLSLEYKPMRPSFHPSPGNLIGQIVPPGKPWPASAEGYTNFSQTTVSPNINLVNRIQGNITTLQTTTNTQASDLDSTTEKSKTTITTLEYKPMRPSFHPSPGNLIGQIVPPGKPWPASAEGYTNFSQTSVSPNVNLVNRIQENGTTVQTTTSTQTSDFDSSTEKSKTTITTLEYNPMRPSFHPNPGNVIKPIIPAGSPWPASAEGYLNFSQTTIPSNLNLENRFKENSTILVPTSTTEKSSTTVFSLGYKPTRPFHRPNPGNYVGQLIPQGEPWPANAEGYSNFSQTTTSRNLIVNRNKEQPVTLKPHLLIASNLETTSSTISENFTTVTAKSVSKPQLFTSKIESSTIDDHIEIILSKLNKTINSSLNNIQASNLLPQDSEDIFNSSISESQAFPQHTRRFERPKFTETPKKNSAQSREFYSNIFFNNYNSRIFKPYFY